MLVKGHSYHFFLQKTTWPRANYCQMSDFLFCLATVHKDGYLMTRRTQVCTLAINSVLFCTWFRLALNWLELHNGVEVNALLILHPKRAYVNPEMVCVTFVTLFETKYWIYPLDLLKDLRWTLSRVPCP